MINKYVIVFIFIFSYAESVYAKVYFRTQWISFNLGRTSSTFSSNSGNEEGIGVVYNAGISTTIFQQIFSTLSVSKVKEHQSPMHDVYNPVEYINKRAIQVGNCFIVKDFCLLPSIGYCWIDGVNRGKWLGEPNVESYLCERISYNSTGISWAIQFNTNATGWVGIGFNFSGILNSNKDYFGASLLLKIGKQRIAPANT